MRMMANARLLQIDETYGPFDAPAVHNPCMRANRHRGARARTCTPWGFATMHVTQAGLAEPRGAGWPRPKLHRRRGTKCWLVPGLGPP